MGEGHSAAHKPRLAWFTPFTRRSAIGVCSKRVVEALSELFDVEVWHPDLGDPIETATPCRPFDPIDGADARSLKGYDHLVYNFGNNCEFHGGIWQTANQLPGVVILHDAVMYHFFSELYLEVKKDSAGFLQLFEKLYGAEAAEAVSRSLRGLTPSIAETAAITKWSMIEACIQSAVGVVIHSGYCKSKIDDIVDCPIVKAGLPVERSAGERVLSRAKLGVPNDDVLVVIAGGLNRNKRADSVIRALGALGEPARKTTLALVGWITDEESERLKEIASSEGVESSIVFVGYASDEVFYSYLSQADICVNLRYPNTEGASASVIEEMLFDNAIVVLDTGVFRELPDHAVARVRLAYEHQDLVRCLDELVRSPGRRRELAAWARAHAEAEYRADLYARKVREVLEASAVASPLLRLADRVSDILSEIGCTRDSDEVGRVMRCIEETFLSDRDAEELTSKR